MWNRKFFGWQGLFGKQEQWWSACIASAENALTNLCVWGMHLPDLLLKKKNKKKVVLCLTCETILFSFLNLIIDIFCSNNECPACRTHCASRRSLRDDPNYDSLIAALYPDIEKYEEDVWFVRFISTFPFGVCIYVRQLKLFCIFHSCRSWLFEKKRESAISRWNEIFPSVFLSWIGCMRAEEFVTKQWKFKGTY